MIMILKTHKLISIHTRLGKYMLHLNRIANCILHERGTRHTRNFVDLVVDFSQ